ncbi:MAG TPA: type II secretion system protein [Candidatus Polarisedimenticolia bacterium]|nr:type II secretion system protein [Candidatus Polarisedimenticolia bacterium]
MFLTRRTGRRGDAGVSLVELVVTVAILAILAGALVPITKFTVKRRNELELRRSLRMMRQAIDQYKKFCDTGVIQKSGVDSECYPPDLETLVDGVEKTGALGQKIKFLRRIPYDPMIKKQEWGMRSFQDDADSSSWGHENVYDVYSTSSGKALDGTEYKDW